MLAHQEEVVASRVCNRCGLEKPASEFYGKKVARCKECSKAASKEARITAKPKRATCKQCGELITGSGREFCSRSCKGIFQHGSPRIEVTCLNCGITFPKKNSHANRCETHFCSRACMDDHYTKTGRVLLTCETCGEEYSAPAHRKESRFCSKVCDAVWRSTLKGEKSNNWKGGVTSEQDLARTTKELVQWKIDVFKRDDYTCQHCGQRGGKLNAHHIKRFRDFPDLRTELSNGITLCVDCHKVETACELSEDYPLKKHKFTRWKKDTDGT